MSSTVYSMKGLFLMAQVRDVVCGMMIESETAKYKSEYQGQTYYFCAPGCKSSFDKQPEKYLQQGNTSQEAHNHH
jgi:YHS domain-containing protein